jgi:uncharacterized repeat protein (TIGR03843 family)
VYRAKAPIGPGSVQYFIEHDAEYHYFNFTEEHRQLLRPVVLFDLLINNADRKGSHVIVGENDHIWLIDHGICFHVEDKLRTVIWDFVGEAIPPELCAGVATFRQKLEPDSELAATLSPYLNSAEIQALAERAGELVSTQRFPPPNPYRRPYPWPQI